MKSHRSKNNLTGRGPASAGLAVLAALILPSGSARAGWTAFNDSAYKEGQTNAANVTTFGMGRNFTGEAASGILKDFGTGDPTPVSVAYTETVSTGSVNSGGDTAAYTEGSDAEGLFGGMVDLSGNMSYGDSPGWSVALTISGLDPAKKYTFAATANRNGGASYAARVTNWKLQGADSFLYAASPGAKKIAEDSAEFSTGDNSAGNVARWVDIVPGADGEIVIRTSHSVGEAAGGIPGASAYQGYAGGVFLVTEQEDSWEAYNDSAYKSTQTNAENVTTIGLGRNFEGQGGSGFLKVLQTGAGVPVIARYAETLSTGSINSGGDAAGYTEGSDAGALFSGKVDLSGNMSYGDSPGWAADLILTGLDPTKKYTFAATANRNGGASYGARVTNWKLIGAESFTYSSSAGARKVAEDSVEFSTGDNAAGNVAEWTNIKPGSDGKIIIRTSHSVGEAAGGIPGASAYQGYAGGVFMVRQQPQGDFRWAGYNDSAWKADQVNSSFVTTIGLGRNFMGQGPGAPLNNLYTGKATGVTAAYVETVSTGSVNSAGDISAYAIGSDAEAYFKGVVDLSGNMSYGDSPGWHVDLNLTGLDPAKSYTWVGTANRNGGASYGARVTNWRILGADSFTYGSSAGAKKVAEDSVEFSTGDNSAGRVARWINIKPGTDGAFTIRTSHSVGEAAGGVPGASQYQGYAGGVFLLAEQLTDGGGQAGNPITFTSLQPAAGTADAHPDTPVTAVLQHGDSAVKAGSIVMKVDGVAVVPTVTIGAASTTVSHVFPATLESASTHHVSLSFTDSSAQAVPYSTEWSFMVLDYSAATPLEAATAADYNPAVHQTRGFAMKIVAPDPNDGISLAGIDDAAALFSGMEYHNTIDAALFNPLGYYLEPEVINYQIDRATKGARAGEELFPGVSGIGTPQQPFALQAQTLLHLQPGYYRVNISMTPGFRLYTGPADAETELPFQFGPCGNCGGDDAPWYTELLVTKAGLYPFRLVFYSGTGGASLEWLTVSATGSRPLVGEVSAAGVPAFVPLFAIPPANGETVLLISRSGNSVTVNWGGAGTLETATDPNGVWTAITGAANPYVTTVTDNRRFFRVRK